MKLTLSSLALLLVLATTLRADTEPFDGAEAQRVAHKLNDTLGSPADAPFATEVDPDKPHGIKAKGVGMLALPDRKLTADVIAAAGKGVTPIGQLWTLALTLATGGRPLAAEQIRLVPITEKDKTTDVQLYYLGAAKNDAGELQLVVFGKDKTQPVVRVPLTKTGGASQSTPIELSGRKQDDSTGILTVDLLGEYSAELTLMKQE